MDSARSQGKVEILLPCQTFDPGRSSFMVHALAVKKGNGNFKHTRVYCEDGTFDVLPVFRAAHHIEHDSRGRSTPMPHEDSFEFAVSYNGRH